MARPALRPLASNGDLVTTVITYTYDSLYRLTAADYDNSFYFHYTYDAVGNRLSQEDHRRAGHDLHLRHC